jgi:hypothetical protein
MSNKIKLASQVDAKRLIRNGPDYTEGTDAHKQMLERHSIQSVADQEQRHVPSGAQSFGDAVSTSKPKASKLRLQIYQPETDAYTNLEDC